MMRSVAWICMFMSYLCPYMLIVVKIVKGKSRVDSGSKFREFLGKIGKVFLPNMFYTCSSISVEATIKIS